MQKKETNVANPKPSDSYVQSFARGLDVIRSFSSSAPRQTLSDVANATGLTRAGARRILLTLQHLGYVQSDGKLFELTPRILDLGYAYLSSMPIWSRAEPVMEKLGHEVQESCSAAVLDGTDIVFVMRIPTHKILTMSLGIGSRLPAYCTSMGRTLLTGLDDETVRSVLVNSDLERHTRFTETSIDVLCEKISQARRQGWSIVCQELEEGLISISAPILNKSGKIVAALNISGHAGRTSAQAMEAEMLQPLLSAARKISEMVAS